MRSRAAAEMIVGDAANFLLSGIPGDLHDEFIMDVEPADLDRASALLKGMGESVRTIHVTLSGGVGSLEARWQGDGAAAFESEIWQPLSHGLGVLERECETAASELARLSVQAEQAHLYKVEELNQEIQTQLYIFAGTTLIGSPQLGGVISEAVGGLAARLGGELVGRIVTGIVEAISALLSKVLDAFYDLLKWAAKPLASALAEIGATVERLLGRIRPGELPQETEPAQLGTEATQPPGPVAISWNTLVKVRKPDPAADSLAERIGGESRVKFANDPAGREFDAVSDTYIGQAKPGGQSLSSSFRRQAKATFEAAKATGRSVYYQFNGPPGSGVIEKLQQYSQRYGVPITVDTTPF